MFIILVFNYMIHERCCQDFIKTFHILSLFTRLSVHNVVLVSLDVLVQRGELRDPPHPGDDEAEGEGVPAHRAVTLSHQNTIKELQTEAEAVVVVLLEPEGQSAQRSVCVRE